MIVANMALRQQKAQSIRLKSWKNESRMAILETGSEVPYYPEGSWRLVERNEDVPAETLEPNTADGKAKALMRKQNHPAYIIILSSIRRDTEAGKPAFMIVLDCKRMVTDCLGTSMKSGFNWKQSVTQTCFQSCRK